MLHMFSVCRSGLILSVVLLLVAPAAITAQQPKPKSTPPAPSSVVPAKTSPAAANTATTGDGQKATPQQPGAATAKGKDAQPAWRLKVTRKAPLSMGLSAKNAPLTEIAAELGRKLKIPVILTPLMQKQRVTLEFEETPLEGALRLLAPQVFVDYELSGNAGIAAKPVGIYLQGLNEEPPMDSTVVKGDSEAILFSGNTEDGLDTTTVEATEKQPLRVMVERSQISVHARKQPLTAVLYEIASKVDIPFEMKYESTELVDVDFNNFSMEQAVQTLSPNIRLYQRTNLTNYEVRPLRLVLVPPTNNQQTTKM